MNIENLSNISPLEKNYLLRTFGMLDVPYKEAEWMPDWADGLPQSQLRYIDALISKTEGRFMVDVGCFIGGFTKVMAAHANKNNGLVYSVDLFDNSTVALSDYHKKWDIKSMYLRNMYERELINHVRVTQGISWEYAKEFEDGSIDFVFIDADHSYKSVKKDILAWLPKVKKGGIIAGHDYEHETYDEQYINEDGHGDRHHGVIKAVNEIFGAPDHVMTIPIWSKLIS